MKYLLRKIWTEKELKFIKENYLYLTYKEISSCINEFNEIKKSEKQVRTKASVLGLSKSKYQYNKRYFEKIDTEEKAYWLGFIYADGYIIRSESSRSSEVSIEISKVDRNHLNKFNSSIEGNLAIREKTGKDRNINGVFVKGGGKSSIIRVHSTDMFRDLKDKGIVQNKTYKEEYPIVEEGFFNHFLRGYFDGDGCISRSKKGCYSFNITCSNKHFLEYISNNLKEICDIDINVKKENDWKFRLGSGKKDLMSIFMDFIYNDSNIYLDRKMKLYKSFKTGSPQ